MARIQAGIFRLFFKRGDTPRAIGGHDTVTACLVVGASGAAQAQVEDIIFDYCEEVEQNVNNAREELLDASADLTECGADLNACLLGQGLFDEPSACIRDYKRCSKVGTRDQVQACRTFLSEFLNDTRRAEKDAAREGVLTEFVDWYNGATTEREECLDPAELTAAVCADQLLGEQ